MTRHTRLPYPAQRHAREPQRLGSIVRQIVDRQRIVKDHRPLTQAEEKAWREEALR